MYIIKREDAKGNIAFLQMGSVSLSFIERDSKDGVIHRFYTKEEAMDVYRRILSMYSKYKISVIEELVVGYSTHSTNSITECLDSITDCETHDPGNVHHMTIYSDNRLRLYIEYKDTVVVHMTVDTNDIIESVKVIQEVSDKEPDVDFSRLNRFIGARVRYVTFRDIKCGDMVVSLLTGERYCIENVNDNICKMTNGDSEMVYAHVKNIMKTEYIPNKKIRLLVDSDEKIGNKIEDSVSMVDKLNKASKENLDIITSEYSEYVQECIDINEEFIHLNDFINDRYIIGDIISNTVGIYRRTKEIKLIDLSKEELCRLISAYSSYVSVSHVITKTTLKTVEEFLNSKSYRDVYRDLVEIKKETKSSNEEDKCINERDNVLNIFIEKDTARTADVITQSILSSKCGDSLECIHKSSKTIMSDTENKEYQLSPDSDTIKVSAVKGDVDPDECIGYAIFNDVGNDKLHGLCYDANTKIHYWTPYKGSKDSLLSFVSHEAIYEYLKTTHVNGGLYKDLLNKSDVVVLPLVRK